MIAERAAAHLVAKSLGTLGVDLFVGYQPEAPDGCVTLFDESTSVADESNAYAVDQYGLQVLVRRKDYREARDASLAIHRALVGFGDAPFDGDGPTITFVQIESAPAPIGRDERDRAEWSAHYMIRVDSAGDLYRQTA